jgi:hypothetical protein
VSERSAIILNCEWTKCHILNCEWTKRHNTKLGVNEVPRVNYQSLQLHERLNFKGRTLPTTIPAVWVLTLLCTHFAEVYCFLIGYFHAHIDAIHIDRTVRVIVTNHNSSSVWNQSIGAVHWSEYWGATTTSVVGSIPKSNPCPWTVLAERTSWRKIIPTSPTKLGY